MACERKRDLKEGGKEWKKRRGSGKTNEEGNMEEGWMREAEGEAVN